MQAKIQGDVEMELVVRADGTVDHVTVTKSLDAEHGLDDAAVAVAERSDTELVALSGGCFQNRVLTERLAGALAARGFRVLLHRQVPPNDGGIALGQIAVAAARLRHGEPAPRGKEG